MLQIKHFAWGLILAALPLNVWAVDKKVTISWTMSDTKDVLGYKMYYSYNTSMANRQIACETSDPTATTLTCYNVNLEQSPVYFAIAAIREDSEANSSVVSETFFTGISMVRDFKIEITSSAPSPPAPAFFKAINFQPENAPIPDGYAIDSGHKYDNARQYGWSSSPGSYGPRDRNNSASPNQAYDTMMHVRPDSVWEISVPNGRYSVTICSGDASWPKGTENVQAEGVTVIDDVPLSPSFPWVKRTAAVTVNDGRLTITFAGSTNPARLCWIKVVSAD